MSRTFFAAKALRAATQTMKATVAATAFIALSLICQGQALANTSVEDGLRVENDGPLFVSGVIAQGNQEVQLNVLQKARLGGITNDLSQSAECLHLLRHVRQQLGARLVVGPDPVGQWEPLANLADTGGLALKSVNVVGPGNNLLNNRIRNRIRLRSIENRLRAGVGPLNEGSAVVQELDTSRPLPQLKLLDINPGAEGVNRLGLLSGSRRLEMNSKLSIL